MKMRARTVAACLRVIDGDTILCNLTCPCCKIISEQRIRLAEIDAAELGSATDSAARAAKEYLATLIQGKMVEVTVRKAWPDKYGRVIGDVYFQGQNVAHRLLAEGYVKRWHPLNDCQSEA